MRNKNRSQRTHARKRAVQRTGITYGKRTRDEWVRQICERQAVFLEKLSDRIHVYAVRHEERHVPVVYDRTTKEITSVCSLDYLEPFQERLYQ